VPSFDRSVPSRRVPSSPASSVSLSLTHASSVRLSLSRAFVSRSIHHHASPFAFTPRDGYFVHVRLLGDASTQSKSRGGVWVGSRARREGRIRVCKQCQGSLTRTSTILIGRKGGSIDRGVEGTHTYPRDGVRWGVTMGVCPRVRACGVGWCGNGQSTGRDSSPCPVASPRVRMNR